ncbi:cytochrome c [Acidicapsa acidisoli]|uniref:cytochrome c n=1 Tax=Acidicapsa acidisoli TaxID=1615681 RepID=UPI0021E0D6FE|nr:cytochrome c [Acidicapsa acidisoli]
MTPSEARALDTRHSGASGAGWGGVALVAITYVYFLIFAQFAFLKRLQDLNIADTHLKLVMSAMALGGITLSLLAPRISFHPSPQLRIRQSLAACAIAALLTLLPLNLLSSIVVSALIGSGLGLLTVTLVTHLRLTLGDHDPLMKVGLGTGIGYLCCNLPALFTASPQTQAIAAATLCFAGILVPFRQGQSTELTTQTEFSRHPIIPSERTVPFAAVLVGFTALVWLDSAAFFIIQSTPALKAGTWQGTLHLWLNGILHLGAALGSAWLLRRRGLRLVLILAFLALASACLLLLDPGRAAAASLLYPVGVSLYSVALVAYPSLLAPASSIAQRGRQAGWIYAIAGWFGSAMGIGMGQNLGHVPPNFVLLAGVVIIAPLFFSRVRAHLREIALVGLVLGAAFLIDLATRNQNTSVKAMSAAERGRQVYISEGCIHCHSQYVRPNTSDVLLWGPVQTVEELRRQHPPLIGNRRQGPDLSEVGTRRSPLWLKAHFFNPRDVSYASIMPSYAYLFRDQRGDDLVAYVSSLQTSDSSKHLLAELAWRLPLESVAEANADEGAKLFQNYCATCHTTEGLARQKWRSQFKRLPPDMRVGPFLHLQTPDTAAVRATLVDRLAQITKFGIAETDMPGHEYLRDREIASISLWLSQTIALPEKNQQRVLISGERQ